MSGSIKNFDFATQGGVPMRVLVAAACVLVAQAAQAQKIGTYTGTNNEGAGVQVVVSSDGNGGLLITGVGDAGTVTCKKTGAQYGYGIGIGGSLAEINGHKAKYSAAFTNLAIVSSYTFHGQNVAGNMKFSVPILESYKAAEACATQPQTFTATLTAEAGATPSRGALAWPLNATHK